MFLALSCKRSTPEAEHVKSKADLAAEYWSKYENDGWGCSVRGLINEFGCEVAAPLFIQSLKNNTNAYVREHIVCYSSGAILDGTDTNACLFAVLGLGLKDKDPDVRSNAWETLKWIKNELENGQN